MCIANFTDYLTKPFSKVHVFEDCTEGLPVCEKTICPPDKVSVSLRDVMWSMKANLSNKDVNWIILAFIVGFGTCIIHKILLVRKQTVP